MKNENLGLMDKDVKMFGKDIDNTTKVVNFAAIVLPCIIVWGFAWALRDAMFCGAILSIYYGLVIALHYWRVDSSLWKVVVRRIFSGNTGARLLYNIGFCVGSSIVYGIIICFYMAYASSGPQDVTLPFPSSGRRLDAVYWFWTGIIFIGIIPLFEVFFYFILQTYSWSQKLGKLIIPAFYGLMNFFWIYPTIGNGWWIAIFTLASIGFGFYLYRLNLNSDILRVLSIRTIIPLTIAIVLLFLSAAASPASPHNFKVYDVDNYWMKQNEVFKYLPPVQ
jgi:hypothetical protein